MVADHAGYISVIVTTNGSAVLVRYEVEKAVGTSIRIQEDVSTKNIPIPTVMIPGGARSFS